MRIVPQNRNTHFYHVIMQEIDHNFIQEYSTSKCDDSSLPIKNFEACVVLIYTHKFIIMDSSTGLCSFVNELILLLMHMLNNNW